MQTMGGVSHQPVHKKLMSTHVRAWTGNATSLVNPTIMADSCKLLLSTMLITPEHQEQIGNVIVVLKCQIKRRELVFVICVVAKERTVNKESAMKDSQHGWKLNRNN